MSTRSYISLTAVLFLAIALLHIIIIFKGLGITIDGKQVSIWVNYFAAFVALVLSYSAIKLKK
jgi:hypothetical protein